MLSSVSPLARSRQSAIHSSHSRLGILQWRVDCGRRARGCGESSGKPTVPADAYWRRKGMTRSGEGRSTESCFWTIAALNLRSETRFMKRSGAIRTSVRPGDGCSLMACLRAHTLRSRTQIQPQILQQNGLASVAQPLPSRGHVDFSERLLSCRDRKGRICRETFVSQQWSLVLCSR